MGSTTIIWTGDNANKPGTINNLFGVDETTAQALVRNLETGGMAGARVDDTGHLLITFTDGATHDLGSVVGPQGERGEGGLQGPSTQAPKITEVRLPYGSWSGRKQTVTSEELKGHLIAVMPPQAPEEATACALAGLWCDVDESTGTLTATCSNDAPTVDVTVGCWHWDNDPGQVTFTLAAGGWTDMTQVCHVGGLDWRDNWVSPADSSSSAAWALAGIRFTHTGCNELTATCAVTPTQDIRCVATVW